MFEAASHIELDTTLCVCKPRLASHKVARCRCTFKPPVLIPSLQPCLHVWRAQLSPAAAAARGYLLQWRRGVKAEDDSKRFDVSGSETVAAHQFNELKMAERIRFHRPPNRLTSGN
ncbi:hypothetical protein PR202_ga03709 [Eleusine coracana subsp. coracana]|uniref:Uncharacterized protein n=1 Tax=Eleusine coracana subsp. coracana TaxID=191504 RepID=A0AAV5BPS5_ELECO|nr:hypothetical protein PR202_ga03709 [Eleusine coracana subsp. coracana]